MDFLGKILTESTVSTVRLWLENVSVRSVKTLEYGICRSSNIFTSDFEQLRLYYASAAEELESKLIGDKPQTTRKLQENIASYTPTFDLCNLSEEIHLWPYAKFEKIWGLKLPTFLFLLNLLVANNIMKFVKKGSDFGLVSSNLPFTIYNRVFDFFSA